MGEELAALYRRIESRCREVVRDQPDWPCAEGCDLCCRRLAEPPRATRAEWDHLRAALERLEAGARESILARVAEVGRLAAGSEPPRHFTCPMLDRERGACLVYEGRLGACRTYGFYVSRDKGLWCERVLALAEARQVLLGNADALEAELSRLGPTLSIAEAFGLSTQLVKETEGGGQPEARPVGEAPRR